MPNIRKLLEQILPNKKIYYRLQELLNSISNDNKTERILLSIEKANHGREYCELSLNELELLYVLYPKTHRSFYECIHENNLIKAYIDFEYYLHNNSTINIDKTIISTLKILFFYLNNTNKSSISTKISLSSILNQFLILNAYVSFFPNFMEKDRI
jgi:hypothetical protein